MRVVIFCHSLVSDWNHGNAHFLRGIVAELQSRGHAVAVWEPRDGWSRTNLMADAGEAAVRNFEIAFPDLASSRLYAMDALNLDEALQGADLVLVHEWNDPELVERIGRHRRRSRYALLFHDTHHRSVTEPEAMARYRLEDYDGVLAFGESVAERYRRSGWSKRVWVWHEAADQRVFYPRSAPETEGDLIWIGNWGDGERTAELEEFLVRPSRQLGLRTRIHGVRYPPDALERLRQAGIEYGWWIPNHRVPEAFARFRMTVHVPRGPYASSLPGIPTIRMFEALACGIPLVSAPWEDSEALFRAGSDYLTARNGNEMKDRLGALCEDADLVEALRRSGLETIRTRHTCAHRVNELMKVWESLNALETGESTASAGIA